jgi:hypothetical protein
MTIENNTMTKFYHHEQQQTNLSEPSSLLTQTTMPSFYPSTRHRTLLTSHLSEHDDDDDPNAIYKDTLIIQIFQHWKIKTLEHQQAINNSKNLVDNSKNFSDTIPPVKTSNTEIIPPETTSNKIEPEKPVITMQKRVTPLPASYLRRKESLKKSNSSPSDFINPNLLAPCTRTRSRTIATTTSTSPKRSHKQGPIFIAPKKTSPSPLPRSHSLFSFEESIQMKRKESLEKQNSIFDDRNSIPISPTWAPAPPTTPTRFYVQSPGSSLDDDDETSSDDGGTHESLLIRNKNYLKKPVKTQQKYPLPSNIIIPTAFYITDPNGHSHLCDLNSDLPEELINSSRIIDNDNIILNSKNEPNSSSDSDKYGLHSIGEEEEESIERNTNNGKILSKELNRIEAFTRSRQTNPNARNSDANTKRNENDKNLLERRWSDGLVSDDDDEQISPSLVKMSSATSIVKQTPPKISKTKYFLMKLHLIPSNKDDDSNGSTDNLPPPPPKRTVRRSSNKKRYQTQ